MSQRHRNMVIATIAIILFSVLPFHLMAQTQFDGTLRGVSIKSADSSNVPPNITVTYTQDGSTFTFDASTSNDPDGSISEFKWDLGDGETATGSSVTHTYLTENSYAVTLTVTDDSGGISLYQVSVSNAVPTVAAEQLIEDADSGNISESKALGQGLFFAENTSVRSITIKSGPSLYGAPPIKIRIGQNKDLSSSYLAESDELTISSKNTEYEFTFDPAVQLTSQTQYYFAISVTNDLNYNFLDFATSSTDSYTPANCPDCHMYYSSTSKWNIEGIKFTTDLYFKVIQ